MNIIKTAPAIIALFITVAAHAATPADSTAMAPRLMARNCLTTAPAEVLPLLPAQTRQDMLNYYDAGRDTPSENAFGGEALIISLDDDCVKMVTGKDITTEIFVLNPTGKNQVIGVIETVATPVPDSRVTFYDTQWRDLGKSITVDPTLADWLPRSEQRNIADIQREVPFVLATMHYDPATMSLIVENNMRGYYPAKDAPATLDMLSPKLNYKWTGKKFVLQN